MIPTNTWMTFRDAQKPAICLRCFLSYHMICFSFSKESSNKQISGENQRGLSGKLVFFSGLDGGQEWFLSQQCSRRTAQSHDHFAWGGAVKRWWRPHGKSKGPNRPTSSQCLPPAPRSWRLDVVPGFLGRFLCFLGHLEMLILKCYH